MPAWIDRPYGSIAMTSIVVVSPVDGGGEVCANSRSEDYVLAVRITLPRTAGAVANYIAPLVLVTRAR